jgi:hypothetical protein
VEVPALSRVIYYGVSGGSAAGLSSGGQCSAHADFVNSCDQKRTYVSYLRQKLDPLGPRLIHTVRFVGYRVRRSHTRPPSRGRPASRQSCFPPE